MRAQPGIIPLAMISIILLSGCTSNNQPGRGSTVTTSWNDVSSNLTTANVVITRSLPRSVPPGSKYTIILTMEVNGKIPAAAGIEEYYPPGWQVSNISYGGVKRDGPGRIEWLFWSMGSPIQNQTVTYDVTIPDNYTGNATFKGVTVLRKRYWIQGDTTVTVD